MGTCLYQRFVELCRKHFDAPVAEVFLREIKD
jgi:hypothetical protein